MGFHNLNLTNFLESLAKLLILYIKATCVSVCLSVATKTRRGPETSEVLKTFKDLNRGVCLSVTTNSAGQGQGRTGQGQGQDKTGQGQGRAGQPRIFFFFFFVLTKTTFFFF
jgi:hypothetical protein